MDILFNGNIISTESRTLLKLRDEIMPEADVMILNGYQTDSDIPLRESDTVCLLKKGVMPDHDQLEALMMARHTPNIYRKLKSASVAIAGLGGLGSNIAAMLARTGIGHILLVDFDIVEPSNLNRQNYYIRHLGQFKAEATAEQLSMINPYLQIDTVITRVTAENASELFRDYDIICEAFDDPESKAELVNTIMTSFPDKPIVSASGMAGYASANDIRTRRAFRNLYLCGDYETASDLGIGLMAPRVNVCAGHQANMILRLILGIREP